RDRPYVPPRRSSDLSSEPTPPVSANTVCTSQPRSRSHGMQKDVSRPPEKARTMGLADSGMAEKTRIGEMEQLSTLIGRILMRPLDRKSTRLNSSHVK